MERRHARTQQVLQESLTFRGIWSIDALNGRIYPSALNHWWQQSRYTVFGTLGKGKEILTICSFKTDNYIYQFIHLNNRHWYWAV